MDGIRKFRNVLIPPTLSLLVVFLLITKSTAMPIPDQPNGSCCFTRLVTASGLAPGDYWVNISAVDTSASAVSMITVTFSGAPQMSFPVSPLLPSSKSASCEKIGTGFAWSCLDRTVDFRVSISGSMNASLPSASVQLEGKDCSLQGVCNAVPASTVRQDDGMWDMGPIGRQPKWLMILCGVLIILIVGGGVIAIWRRRYGSVELKTKRYSSFGSDELPQEPWNGAGSSSKPGDSFLGRRPTIARESYEKSKSSRNNSSDIEDSDSIDKSLGSSYSHRGQLDSSEPGGQAFPSIGGVPSQGGYSFTSESGLAWNTGAVNNVFPIRRETRKASFDSARTAADREPGSALLTRKATYILPSGESRSRPHRLGEVSQSIARNDTKRRTGSEDVGSEVSQSIARNDTKRRTGSEDVGSEVSQSIARNDTKRRTGSEDVGSMPRARTLLEESELQRQQMLLLAKLPSLAAAAVTPTSGVKPLVDISEMSLSLSTTALERSASEKILRQQSKKKQAKSDEANQILQQLQRSATGLKVDLQRSSSTLKGQNRYGEASIQNYPESIASAETTHHAAKVQNESRMHRAATTKSPKRKKGRDGRESLLNGADALKRSATTTASSKLASDVHDDEDIPLWKIKAQQLGGGDDDEVPLSEVLARSMSIHRPFATPQVGDFNNMEGLGIVTGEATADFDDNLPLSIDPSGRHNC